MKVNKFLPNRRTITKTVWVDCEGVEHETRRKAALRTAEIIILSHTVYSNNELMLDDLIEDRLRVILALQEIDKPEDDGILEIDAARKAC